jgi:hypothetical protein
VATVTDLKAVFDEHINRGDPRERRHAVRAFETCVPVFLPSAGQAPSPQAYIDAVSATQHGDRRGAYRALFERCRRLLDQGQDWLTSTALVLKLDPQHREPGFRAQEALLTGDYERVAPLFAQALTGADPDDVASLSGIALKIMRLRYPDGMEDAEYRRAVAVDTALSLLACDLGRDCGAQSLWSLQLCVGEGLCPTGGHPAWLRARVAKQAKVEPEGVEQQRQRLLGLIRSGHALQTTDILPR